MQKRWLPVLPLLQFLSWAGVRLRLIMDRDIMEEQDIMEVLVSVPDTGHHFTVRNDSLVGIDTSVINICMADIDILTGDTSVVDIDGTLVADIFAVDTGILVVGTEAGTEDTSAMGGGEMAIAAVIVADEIC